MTRTKTLFRNGLLVAALAAFASSSAFGECGAYAGSTLMAYGPDCLENGHAIISGVPNGDAVVPEGFTTAFYLSRTNGLIIEQVGPTPYFEVATADVWRIHTLVFDPTTFDPSDVEFGVTTGFDIAPLFVAGGGSICGAMSFVVYGTKTVDCKDQCDAFAAPVTIDSTLICLVNGQATLTAVLDGEHGIPEGFEAHYVLSRTNGLIIEQIAEEPSFTVSGSDIWRIHSFVYDPETFDLGSVILGQTSVYDVYPELTVGGGTICADMVINGTFVKTGECKQTCEEEAGGLTTEQPDLCLIDGQATATAIPDGEAYVPSGAELVYFLVQDGVIQEIGDGPSFLIGSLGQFGIHAFVFYPTTFDITWIVSGETTLDDLADHIGEQDLCASLDLDGVLFQVADCTPTCDADAGAMTGGGQTICLEEGMAELTAVSFGDTIVPAGFTLIYLLSEGIELAVQAWNDEASFTVDHAGEFRIHAFVLDHTTLDLDGIEWGTTTILDLNGQLVQGEGDICAGLDVWGASFTVEACAPPCDGGEDTEITVCYGDEPFAMLDVLGGDPCPGGIWTNPANPQVSGTFNPASDAAGIYTYTVIGVDGTVYASTLTINVFECPEDLIDAPMERTPTFGSEVVVWPNPADGVVHVALPLGTDKVKELVLIDASGRTVIPRVLHHGAQELVLDVSSLSKGFWSVRLVGSTTHLGRFVR